jgi:transposase
MSQIYTAELHHVGPFDYLVALLRHATAVALDPAAWMPWNYTTTLAPGAPRRRGHRHRPGVIPDRPTGTV